VFLMGDAAACAKAGQKVPQGFYNIGDMLGMVIRAGGEVAVCGTCIDARGIAADDLVEGARRGTLDQLTEWTLQADKALVF
ncbi:MAG: DsrE family protein, partial [Bacteroidetes bacterium]|nr:DsrE family protein [Bacteroidota bacterium]